jgi:FkbM family methyltransferase
VIEASRIKYGIEALSPNENGKCWFHGQKPHHQDREVFKRLGGKIGECEAASVVGARYSSEAEMCDCTAPTASNFGKGFLEIGSADGQYLSNLLFFEMQLNWTGFCIEGSPVSFALLEENRPRCTTINAVIGPDEGSRTFYTFDSPSSWEIGMSCMQGTACGNSDEDAQRYADERKLELKKESVRMQKLSDIFATHGAEEFGWLMVDVEGAEDIVLPTIDFGRVRAQLVSYEGEHPVAFEHLQNSRYEQIMQVGPDRFFANIVE